jgi:hypothetical protein
MARQQGLDASKWWWMDHRPVRLAYQPPANNTFLSQQTSHQQPASITFLSKLISTNHQPPAKRTGRMDGSLQWAIWSFRK